MPKIGAVVIGVFLLIAATHFGTGTSGQGEQGPTAASAPSTPLPLSTPAPVVAAPETKPTCVSDPLVPANGKELMRGGRGGHGVLTIDNGSGYDAIVALYDQKDQRIVRRLYVRSSNVGRATSILPGNYSIRFAFGNAYSANRGRFCSFSGASEFDRPVEYVEYETEDGLRYKEARIGLLKVENGNARTHGIDADLVFGDATTP